MEYIIVIGIKLFYKEIIIYFNIFVNLNYIINNYFNKL